MLGGARRGHDDAARSSCGHGRSMSDMGVPVDLRVQSTAEAARSVVYTADAVERAVGLDGELTARRMVDDPGAVERIDQTIDLLDATIGEIRSFVLDRETSRRS